MSDIERLTAELALRLSNAWVKYRAAFGGEPRGTERQMAALLQLAGIERFFSDRSSWQGSHRLVYNRATRKIDVVRSVDGLVLNSFDPPEEA